LIRLIDTILIIKKRALVKPFLLKKYFF